MFQIYPNREMSNIIGKDMIEVETLQVQNGYITVGHYHVPLSNILYVKEV